MNDIADNVETLRLQLLANGYTPIRNRDKRTFMKNWPNEEITPDVIRSWTRRNSRDTATGLRVERGLAVIDLDINDGPAMAEIANAILDALPTLDDINTPLLVRRGKGAKEAWFVRSTELFSRLHSRSWVKRGESVDAGTHRVEIFGGGSPRQFGAFGPHTVDDDVVVQTVYGWADRSPADTLQSELPLLTKAQLHAVVDVVETTLARLGWEPVARSSAGESEAVRVYDLDDTMRFALNTGGLVTLDELRGYLKDDPDAGLRCTASFLEGREAVNPTRCLVSLSRGGHVMIWDSATAVTHSEASAAPSDYTAIVDRLGEHLRALETVERNKVNPSDGAALAAAKLIETYAYCKHQQANAVPIWATSLEDGVLLTSLRLQMLPNCDEEIGPRGGVKKINPVDLWMSSEKRVSVRGLRMRPDKPRPLYEENGERWVNIYAPPVLASAGGTAAPGVAFLDYLLPDEYERRWFTQWLAHKVRYPHIPGPAVVMVARQQGTGRGTLGEIVSKLLGQAYVRSLPFHIFAGKSYQSQYDDWGASALLVLVSESSERNGGSQFANKQDTYEHLKEKVEPKPVDRLYVSKGTKSFTARHFTSYLIATNNLDALPIPAEDRRFAVLSNGEACKDERFWVDLNTWLDRDENIGAFAEWLGAIDLSDYSPYTAPRMTETKSAMVEMGGSDVDRGVALALESMPGDCFTIAQIVERMRIAASEYDLSYPMHWQDIVKRIVLKSTYRVGVRNGMNWHPRIEDKRPAVYAKTAAAARKWSTSEVLREEVLRNKTNGAASLSAAIISFTDRVPRAG